MEEYTNSPEVVDDGSDMFLDDEPTSEITEDVEQPEQENADPVQPEQKEAPAEKGQTLKVKYNGEEKELTSLKGIDSGMVIRDIQDRPVLLLSNEWSLRWVEERNPDVRFLAVPQDARRA